MSTTTDRLAAGLTPEDFPQITRFWSGVDTRCREECWEWKKSVNLGGYGQTRWLLDGKWMSVTCHRAAFVLSGGKFTLDKTYVLHSCHNRKCCNPAHLRAGNAKDNVKDMHDAGRANPSTGDKNGARKHPEKLARGDRSGARLHPESRARGDRHGSVTRPDKVLRGEAHGRSKLTEDKVTEIRQLFADGGVTKSSLAKQFGVGNPQIGRIIQRKKWGHVK